MRGFHLMGPAGPPVTDILDKSTLAALRARASLTEATSPAASHALGHKALSTKSNVPASHSSKAVSSTVSWAPTTCLRSW